MASKRAQTARGDREPAEGYPLSRGLSRFPGNCIPRHGVCQAPRAGLPLHQSQAPPVGILRCTHVLGDQLQQFGFRHRYPQWSDNLCNGLAFDAVISIFAHGDTSHFSGYTHK